MLLEKGSRLGFTVIPGITRLTPGFTALSARLRNGTRFGVNGLGDAAAPLDLSQMSLTDIASAIQQGLATVNAQEVFQINLQRLQNGLPAIPTQFAAPTFNLGIAGVSPTLLLVGAGLLLFVLLKK